VTVYILMYFTAALLALSMQRDRSRIMWFIMGLFLIIIIGWRHYVGGDWYNYLMRFEETSYLSYDEVLRGEDPGYYLINFLMYDLGFEIYAVNFISAVIFVSGLMRFARKQYSPWLVIAVAIPYLVIVVAMGYTRQGVAIGLVMWALALLDEKKLVRFLLLTVLAATFHKSAVLMIGIGIFGQGTSRWLRILAIFVVGVGTYMAFLEEHQARLWENYVDVQMESQGAKIRVFMNLIPALFLFALRDRWKIYFKDYGFWRVLALGAVVSVFVVGLASTAVDRMALYMIPLQLVVFSRLPLLLGHRFSSSAVTVMVLLYYAAVLFVWLNFGAHTRYWIPYDNYLWYDLFE